MTTLQHYLYKLISEEVLAFETYKVLNTLFQKKIRFEKTVIDLLDEISDDEYSDHAAKLIDYARRNGLGFPVCNADYESCASESAVLAFRNLPPGTTEISQLIKFAIDLEADAINSYNEALQRGLELPEFDEEIISIMEHNLKDELEHFDKLQIAYAAACEQLI